jgi:hypothetical protein
MIRYPRGGQGEFITASRRLLFTRSMLRWIVGTVICMNVCSDDSVQATYQLSSMYEGWDVPLEHALDGLSDIVCEMKSTGAG